MPDSQALLNEADEAIQSKRLDHALRVITTVSQDEDLAPTEAKHLMQTAVLYSNAKTHQSSLALHFLRCATCQIMALAFGIVPTKLGSRLATAIGKKVNC